MLYLKVTFLQVLQIIVTLRHILIMQSQYTIWQEIFEGINYFHIVTLLFSFVRWRNMKRL